MRINPLVAEAKKAAAQQSTQVTSVNLDDPNDQNFLSRVILNKGLQNKDGAGMVNIPAVVEALVLQSKRIDALMQCCMWVVNNGGALQDLIDSDGEEAYVKLLNQEVANYACRELHDNYMSNLMQAKDYRAFVAQAYKNLQSEELMIKDSTRYSGGKDIIFSGSIDQPCMKAPARVPQDGEGYRIQRPPKLIKEKNEERYNERYYGDFTTPLSEGILDVLKKFREEFLGGTDLANAHKRDTKIVPLKYNFEKWRARFEKAGLKLSDENATAIFKNLTVVVDDKPRTDKVVGDMEGVFSVAIVNNPAPAIHQAGSPWFQKVTRNINDEYPEGQMPKNEDFVCPVSHLLQANFGFTLVMHLPANVVDYITQTEDKGRQLFKLYSWAQLWSSCYCRGKGTTGGVRNVPSYVLSPSVLPEVAGRRKKEGLKVIDTMGDENGMSVAPNGGLQFLPSREDFDPSFSRKYEQLNEDLLKTCLDAGMPPFVSGTRTTINNAYLVAAEDEKFQLKDKIFGIRNEMKSYEGQLLGYDLDFGIMVYAGSQPGSILSKDISGSTVPEVMSIADYLGFDFSSEGEPSTSRPFVRSMLNMVDLAPLLKKRQNKDKNDKNQSQLTEAEILSGDGLFVLFKPLFQTYIYLRNVYPDKYLSGDKIIQQAMEELGIENLDEDPLNRNIYRSVINNKEFFNPSDPQFVSNMMSSLRIALSNASASYNSNLAEILREEYGTQQNVQTQKVDDHRFFQFSGGGSTMADFGNMYNHLGGRMLKIVCDQLCNVDPKTLCTPLYSEELENGPEKIQFPSYEALSGSIMPMAIMLSKYVPRAQEIFEQAEDQQERLQEARREDGAFDLSELNLKGIKDGTAVFPHQSDALSTLATKPKFAILDIAPGGGKTILGVMDIVNLISSGEDIKPLVIAPNKLVGNWCDDINKVTEAQWNTVSLTTESVKGWDEETLDDIIGNAPKNTIFICGISWLKNHTQKATLSIGKTSVDIPKRVDFLRKHGFNYIMLDESHKAKKSVDQGNNGSGVHRAIRGVTTLDYVKYVRLATGTLVHDQVKDVVGQANLFTASIYGTVDKMEESLKGKDDAVRSKLVRSKLDNHVAMISKKRKSWAFMLPNPIDNFIQIPFTRYAPQFKHIRTGDTIDYNPAEEMEGQEKGEFLHAMVYQAVLKITEEKAKKDVGRRTDEEEDDDDNEDENNEEGGVTNDEIDTVEDKDGNVVVEDGALSTKSMNTHTQRLEQLLTDPFGDPEFQRVAKLYGVKKTTFTPFKIQAAIERLNTHFSTVKYDPELVGKSQRGIVEWERGMNHRELDLVDYDGVTYMARNLERDGSADRENAAKRIVYPEPSIIPPPEDPERWKQERTGKVIIFCRFTRTTDAVYYALPRKWKRMAKRFHGSLSESSGENKWANLEAFRDPTSDVKILVANEQAITEGHNLQIGSRIIRVEAPWSPGDYEQATARIFRPDVAAANLDEDGKPGDMAREVIFTDWLMCDGTIEIAKIARLAHKMVDNTKFEEKDNPRYRPLDDYGEPMPRMNMDLLRENQFFDDFRPYFSAKATLNSIQANEFWEMRKSTVSSMLPVEVQAPDSDFGKLHAAPTAPNVHIKGEMFDFERFIDWIGSHKEEVLQSAGDFITGMPIRTPFGYGTVVGHRRRFRKPTAAEVEKGYPLNNSGRIMDMEAHGYSSLQVRLSRNAKPVGQYGPNSLVTVSPIVTHLPKGVSQEELDRFFKTDKPWATEKQGAAFEKAEREAQEAEEREAAEEKERKEKKDRKKQEATTDAKIRRGENSGKRQQNAQEGKPVNQDLPHTGSNSSGPLNDAPRAAKAKVVLKITTYNGFLALTADLGDPDTKSFDKEFGFTDFRPYVYMDIQNYNHYMKFDAWLDHVLEPELYKTGAKKGTVKKEARYKLPKATMDIMQDALDAFVERRGKEIYDRPIGMKQAAGLPDFLRTKRRRATGKDADRKLTLYPIMMDDRVRFCFDIFQSPKLARELLREPKIAGIPGGKWQASEGATVYFAKTKKELAAKIKEIAAVYRISNGKSLKTNFDKLTFRRVHK